MFELLNAFGECAHACMIKPAVDALNPAADRKKGFARMVDEMLGNGSGGGRKPEKGYAFEA